MKPSHPVAEQVVYVDATVMIPTLKKALSQPAGIARAGFEMALLGANGSGGVLVADPAARRVLCVRLAHCESELAVFDALRGIARSLQRTPLQQAWTWLRSRLAAPVRSGWTLPGELAQAGGRGVFVYHGLNIKPGFLAAMQSARELHGTRLVWYLHDLLPLTQPPDYTGAERAREFRAFASRFLASCDLVVTSSRHTASELPEAAGPLVRGALPPVAVVPLAHEYRPWQTGSARPALPGLADHDFVLCAGSISARKNQLGLVRAWQTYRAAARRARPAHLVLAGAMGAGSDEVLALLAQTGSCGGTVHVLPQPSDPELTWLYENCSFTAYVSFAEGFGLPIGESLWLGKTCLASSTTSMPEVGGDLVVYVNPHRVDDMAAQLQRMLDEPETVDALAQKISRTRLRSWRDFRSDLAEALRLHFSS